jgi:plastocyanin
VLTEKGVALPQNRRQPEECTVRSWLARCFVVVVAFALPVGGAGVAKADVVFVEVNSNFFDPIEITVAPGDTVCWFWSKGLHTTTSLDGLWDSDILGPGSMFEYTFTTVGDYYYYCSRHLDCCGMAGVVHVVSPCCPPPCCPQPPGSGAK